MLEYLTGWQTMIPYLGAQRFFQGKQLSRVVTLVLDHAIAAIARRRDKGL